MTLYKRNWNCACCDGELIYDSEAKTVTCKCASVEVLRVPTDLQIREDWTWIPSRKSTVEPRSMPQGKTVVDYSKMEKR